MFLTAHSDASSSRALAAWTHLVLGVFLAASYSSLHSQDLSDCAKAANFPLRISLYICPPRSSSFFFFFFCEAAAADLFPIFSAIVLPSSLPLPASLPPPSFPLEFVPYPGPPSCISPLPPRPSLPVPSPKVILISV